MDRPGPLLLVCVRGTQCFEASRVASRASSVLPVSFPA